MGKIHCFAKTQKLQKGRIRMSKPRNYLKVLVLLGWLLPLALFAGDTGKITGRVVDKETGNPLPGVNVILEGTSYGAATDENGEFMILFVPPGLYTVKFSFIGYAEEAVSNVRVTIDLTTNMYTIEMTPEAIRGEAVTVTAEKPIIEITATNEVRVVRQEDIQNMSVRGYTDVAALQTGVVVDAGGNLHVRGGRTDEVGYYVDGVYVNNSYTLGRSGDVPNLSLEEVSFQSGGFGAEYGSANAGIIQTTTRTGGNQLEITLEGISDAFVGSADPSVEKPFAFSYGYNLLSGAVGGPIPGMNWIRYFGSFEQTKMADASPTNAVFPVYEGELDPVTGIPVTDETFTDLNGNYVWDQGEPYVDANNNGKYDPYLNIDINDIKFKYGPKPNNGLDRFSFAGNLLFDFQPLLGQAWKLKVGGSAYSNERTNYTHSYSLFNYYNTASTAAGIGTDGDLKLRFNKSISTFGSFYARLTGNVPGMEKMFFSLQYSRSQEGYSSFDPVFKKGYGTWVWDDGTVSEEKLPYLQNGKREDLFNPVWIYEDTAGNQFTRDYWDPDTNLSLVQVSYDTVWINPLFTDVGSRPIPYQELANFHRAGRAGVSYTKRNTSRDTYKGSITWQVGSHELKIGGEYQKNVIRYYRMARSTSLSRYFWNNRAYSPTQDIYTWDPTYNDGAGAKLKDYKGDGIPDYLQDPDDTWNPLNEDGEPYFGPDGVYGTADDLPGADQFTHQDYMADYIQQAYGSAYAENIGWDVTGRKKVDSGTDKARRPIIGAFYIQDKFEIKDMILNLGVRYDYIDPANKIFNPETGGRNNIVIAQGNVLAETVYAKDLNGNGEFDPEEYLYSTPTDEDQVGKPHRIPSKVRSLWSPRIGLAFPVTDKTVFHAQYGKYFQQPELNRMFISYTRFIQNLTQGNFTISANPDLQPVETTQYEIGFKQMLSQDVSIDATVFYKQMTGYVQIRNVAARPTGYAIYVNGDYGTVKGLSLSFKTRRIRNVMVDVNYTLQYAGGTGSSASGLYRIAWQGGNNPTYVSPLDFDQRHTGSIQLDYRTGARSRLPLFGTNLLLRFGSGLPYTPSKPRTEIFGGQINYQPTAAFNSAYMPWSFQLDMKIDKSFRLGRYTLNVFVWILNALDRQNIDSVYPSTGLPNSDGYLNTPEGEKWLSSVALGGSDFGQRIYTAALENPYNYNIPRQVRIGFRVDL
jgi:outer membrane receptor protein involved in Fe transport